MNVPASAFASLAIACNTGLDRDEMTGFTYDDAIAAIEDGVIIQQLNGNLSAQVSLSAVLPWQDEVNQELKEYVIGYGHSVADHTGAESKGLCVVLGLAIALMQRP